MERQFLIIFWWWLRHCSWERVPKNLLIILLRCHFRRCFFSPSITSLNFIKNSMYFPFSSSVQWEVEYSFLIGGLSSKLQITFLGLNTHGLNLLSSRSKEPGLEAYWEYSCPSCMQLSLILVFNNIIKVENIIKTQASSKTMAPFACQTAYPARGRPWEKEKVAFIGWGLTFEGIETEIV